MRITIRIDDQLHADAKAIAARTGRTMSAVMVDAIRETFLRRAQAARELPTPPRDHDAERPR